MQVLQPSILVTIAVLGSAAYALTRDPPATAAAVSVPVVATSDEAVDDVPDIHGEDQENTSDDLEPDDEPAAITWTTPAAWPAAPNPSSMRIATYRVPRGGGDTVDAELSIARAGGATDANIDRWVGQFTQRSTTRRTTKILRGLPVTIVDIEGTYESGMGTDSSPHSGWAMLGAIVQARGLPYFFKLTGPVATVRAARPSFEAMLDGIRPTNP